MNTDELLIKYLAGETDESERLQTEQWIKDSDANKKYFERIKLILETSQIFPTQQEINTTGANTINVDAQWERLRSKIHGLGSQPGSSRFNYRQMSIGISIALLVGVALIWRYTASHTKQLATTAHAPVDTLVLDKAASLADTTNLPDSSLITMSDNAPVNTAQLPAVQATITDSMQYFKSHQLQLQQLLKDPVNWPHTLQLYRTKDNDIDVRRIIIRNMMADLKNNKWADADTIKIMRLNEREFIINGHRLPDTIQQRLRTQYIRESGFYIYYGGKPKIGSGIYLPTDSL